MSDPLKHHYLPVFYLKQWKGADKKVTRYWRPQNKVVASRLAPSNTGYEPLLYTLEGYPPVYRQKVERGFMGQMVDGPASKALKVLLERDEAKLTVELRSAWARFLIATKIRNPEMVAHLVASTRQGLEHKLLSSPEYLSLKSDGDPPTFLEWVEKHRPHALDDVGKLLLPPLIDHQEIGDAIVRMKWSVLDLSKSDHDLLTSDRPFVMTMRLADRRCLIACPIAPRTAFIATHDRTQEKRLLKNSPTAIAKRLNDQVVRQAVRHVYGSSSAHLGFVEKRLRQPGVPEPLPDLNSAKPERQP
jgi:hypothetical protein